MCPCKWMFNTGAFHPSLFAALSDLCLQPAAHSFQTSKMFAKQCSCWICWARR